MRRNTEFLSAVSVTRKAPPDMDWRCTNARLMTKQTTRETQEIKTTDHFHFRPGRDNCTHPSKWGHLYHTEQHNSDEEPSSTHLKAKNSIKAKQLFYSWRTCQESKRCCPSLVPSFSLCWAFAYRLLHKRLQLSTDAAGPQHPSSSAVGDGLMSIWMIFAVFTQPQTAEWYLNKKRRG